MRGVRRQRTRDDGGPASFRGPRSRTETSHTTNRSSYDDGEDDDMPRDEEPEGVCQHITFLPSRTAVHVWRPFVIQQEEVEAAGKDGDTTSPPPPCYITNLADYPGYHSIVPSSTVEALSPTDTTSGSGISLSGDLHYTITDADVYTLPPLMQQRTAALGCKTHGPFKCSCAFFRTLSLHLKSLRQEFGMSTTSHGQERSDEEPGYIDMQEEGDAGADLYSTSEQPNVVDINVEFFRDISDLLDPRSPRSPLNPNSSSGTSSNTFPDAARNAREERGPSRIQGNAGLNDRMVWGSTNTPYEVRQRVFAFLNKVTNSVGSVVIVCKEEKMACAVIVSRELPIAVERRLIGPFSIQPVDNLTTIKAAVQTQARDQLIAPECSACQFRGMDLRRCFGCARLICGKCASDCGMCKRKGSFCDQCVIVSVEGGIKHPICSRCFD